MLLGSKPCLKAAILAATAFLSACSSLSAPLLTVIKHPTRAFLCDGAHQITITHFQLSDQSLAFAKIQLPELPEFTLPQVNSASGITYANGSVQWTEKGKEASVWVLEKKDEWQPLFRDCMATSND